MLEKNTQSEESTFKKERFEFVLTVNDYIVCRRYFHISGFKRESLYSEELRDAVKRCVDIIRKDLQEKTDIFNWYSAPQVYQDVDEMNAKCHSLENPRYIVLRSCPDVYIWNGEKAEPYTKAFNRTDYVEDDEVSPCVLKFTMYDNGFDLRSHREVISTTFDGNEYPRFIRTSIDLSNSRNKYEKEGVFAPFEAALVNLMKENRADLIPQIVSELCDACSMEDKNDYTTILKYGGKSYNCNVRGQQERYVRTLEYQCRKRTEAFLKES
jgi:hypothetical protein